MSRDNGDAISKSQEAVLSGRKGWRVRVEYFSVYLLLPGLDFLPGVLMKEAALGTSLVVQWLRLHLPMQGVWFDP